MQRTSENKPFRTVNHIRYKRKVYQRVLRVGVNAIIYDSMLLPTRGSRWDDCNGKERDSCRQEPSRNTIVSGIPAA